MGLRDLSNLRSLPCQSSPHSISPTRTPTSPTTQQGRGSSSVWDLLLHGPGSQGEHSCSQSWRPLSTLPWPPALETPTWLETILHVVQLGTVPVFSLFIHGYETGPSHSARLQAVNLQKQLWG